MPIYKGSVLASKNGVFVGNTEIGQVYHGRDLVYTKYRFPTTEVLPNSYTQVQVARVDGANSTYYTVPQSGFYKVVVKGSDGGVHANNQGGKGGYTEQIIYMYKGQMCVLWGASSGHGPYGSLANQVGRTGYPGGKGNLFGGHGATGPSGEYGAGGGGGTEDGMDNPGYSGGMGGGGAGFVTGFTNHQFLPQTKTAGSLTVNINAGPNGASPFYIGSAVFCSITSYVICGGGGGGCGTSGSYRSSGGGGGAFGNGGNSLENIGESGPAGTWGKGLDGVRYGGQTGGAWAIIDFSRGLVNWGTTGGASGEENGYCILYRLTN